MRKVNVEQNTSNSNLSFLIDDIWKKYGGRRGLDPDQWPELTPKGKNLELENWLLLFDEFLFWLMSYNLVLQSFMVEGQLSDLDKCRLSISASCISFCLSMRQLAVMGHDVPTRHLMRALREYVDVLNLIIIKPELATEFILAQDTETGNNFWHKHVSKGKALKVIKTNKLISDSQPSEVMENWRKKQDKLMALSSHPCYLGGILTLAPNLYTYPEPSHYPFNFLGAGQESCVTPIIYAVDTLYEMMCLNPIPNNIPNQEFLKEIVLGLIIGKKVTVEAYIYYIKHQGEQESIS